MPPHPVNFDRLLRLTGLSLSDLKSRQAEFQRQFPRGKVTKEEFRSMSRQVMPQSEVAPFVDNVYAMFDANNDDRLDFEEFIMAVSAKDTGATHVDKLAWLFDNVYDKDGSGVVNKRELEGILRTLLHMERVSGEKTKEIMADIFKELDSNHDGSISKMEFITAASKCDLLRQILTTAANKEQQQIRQYQPHPQATTSKSRPRTFQRRRSSRKSKK